MERRGRCLCGAITYTTSGRILWAGHCHCDSCRRASSAPMTSFLGVPRGTVTWSSAPATYRSSPEVTRGFCPTCGSQMCYESTFFPDETHLYAATLDDPSTFQPQAHYHYAERLPFLKLNDDLPKHSGMAD
ncbi:GFA family protein [Algirhabdus cladophorae]|uniref:GFA family protein n=1 Tax=Algirhabdus cladophorae TaxID=3377108 RepID=UPI003B84A3A1